MKIKLFYDITCKSDVTEEVGPKGLLSFLDLLCSVKAEGTRPGLAHFRVRDHLAPAGGGQGVSDSPSSSGKTWGRGAGCPLGTVPRVPGMSWAAGAGRSQDTNRSAEEAGLSLTARRELASADSLFQSLEDG